MSNTAAAKILVFDSGVGGLSILQALQQRLPRCEFIYASDNQAFPYGTKSADFLIDRVARVLQKLIVKIQPDIVVVACNTASTLVLPHIRRQFSIPVVGVVPAIKPAAELSKTGVIGLLGTPGTVSRDYTKALIEEFAADCEVVSVGSAELVELAEAALRGTPPPPEKLCTLLQALFDNTRLDTIVLACTHFPLIKNQMINVAPRPINWVDSGEAIARRVSSLVSNKPDITGQVQTTSHSAIFTGRSTDIDLLTNTLTQFKLTHIKYIEV